MKHALVTGGAGLIGSHLVDLLVESDYEVTVLDNLEEQTHPKGKPFWVNPKARFIQGDMRNDSNLREALEGVRFVFHLAAFVGFTAEISKYLDVNSTGTARLFQEIAKKGRSVEKVVVASSQAVYGEGAYECTRDGIQFPSSRPFFRLQQKKWELPCPKCGTNLKPTLTSEEKSREGGTPYALSKEFEERFSLVYGKQLSVPVVALRFAVTYGPRQSVFNPYTGVASIFSTRILNGLSPLVYEDGEQTRDFIYVGDVAKAALFVLENDNANFQVFNVSTGRATKIKDLVRHLGEIFGKRIDPNIPGEFRLGDVRHIVPDPGKLTKLGFQATTPLEKGLFLFADWMRSQGDVKEYFTEAYDQLKRNRIIYG